MKTAQAMVCISRSANALVPKKGTEADDTSKTALNHLVRELAVGLRSRLANYYAQRTLTRKPILPQDCANAIVWLSNEQSAKTTGHIIPVDGGLEDAFLR